MKRYRVAVCAISGRESWTATRGCGLALAMVAMVAIMSADTDSTPVQGIA